MEAISLGYNSDEFIEIFCNKHKNISHKDLKRIDEFHQIEDPSIKEKIYHKIRYNHLKSNCSIIENVTYLHKDFSDYKKTIKSNISFESFFKCLICTGIFFFLANESVHFYKEMRISNFFSYLLPFLLETSVFFLFLKKDYISKLLLFFVVIFNIVTFSMNTINSDIKNLEIQSNNKEQLQELAAQKSKKEKRILELEGELSRYRILYGDLIKQGYFKKADETLKPEIIKIEASLTETINFLPTLNIQKVPSVTYEYNILKNVTLSTANLVALKIILLFVFLLFINDLKYLFSKEEKACV